MRRDGRGVAGLSAATGFFALVALIIVVSPLLAYPAHLLVTQFTDLAFHKTVKYITLACGLFFCAVYLKMHRMLSWTAFGFGVARGIFWRDLVIGMGVGIVLLLALVAAFLALDIWAIRPDLAPFWSDLHVIVAKAAVTGVVVALIEESMFRGALFSVLYRRVNAFYAVLLTSVVYAAVHFLAYKRLPGDTEISWLTGVFMVPDVFVGLLRTAHVDHFLALFALGCLLSLMRLAKGHIALCVGVHAGIVMALKTTGKFGHYTSGGALDFLVGQSGGPLGFLAFGWLVLVAAVYWRMTMASPRRRPFGGRE